MTLVRRAVPEDAEEVLRLRQVMLDSVFGTDSSSAWHTESLSTVRGRLADPDGDFAAFVVDHPDRPDALAALVAGTIDYRIGNPANPRGAMGYVFSVATDPDARRRGYARAGVETLLDWFRERGVPQVNLNASEEAEPLYASLGFVRKPDPSMRLQL
ncbi:GNAT family N-acetyltransferase [Streptomyces sp. NBC_00620]|uniref:GNAT family N-acetyltransferase n=1 Tax=Streptomyces sp. NBC_00620 TaxID=2903666 RepID=UPI0022505A65|nr:GNAT family N-acetyltransferase [Streptomyces sp. NBC_00620]MCX4974848.1 GNAT family N-acetyltransferase [Streptomyces sp. NBC_00620]